jgi:hypothetical protein
MKKKNIFYQCILFAILYANTILGQAITTCSVGSTDIVVSYASCSNGEGVECTSNSTFNWSLQGSNNYLAAANGNSACFPLQIYGYYSLAFEDLINNETGNCGFYYTPKPLSWPSNALLTGLNLANRAIDNTKAVGTMLGSQSVSLTGGANYSVPISLPSGTNGMEPSLAVVYNSQGKGGLLGQGWSITGLSEIMRVGETLVSGAINVTAAKSTLDNFALNGELLIKDGNEYKTQNESFSRVIPTFFNSDIESFIVESKGGQKFEYGIDSRLSANGKNIAWKLSKAKDLFGNYVEYKYLNLGTELLIDEIKYTGTAIAAPFNRIKFEYARKIDENPIFHADSKFENAYVIKSITIIAEGQVHSVYRFKYGFDKIHTYLIEAQLEGANGNQLNFTLFKYGNTPSVDFEVEQNTFPSHSNNFYDLMTGDYDGNGMSDGF